MADIMSTSPATAASPSLVPASGGDDAPEPTLSFPLDWLLTHGSPAIQYRAAVEVARVAPPAEMQSVVYASGNAIRLAVTQSIDGTWNGRMLSIPKSRTGVAGVGTIPAVQRLVESCWDRESPPLAQARRPLFRLLAEDNDPNFLYELAGAKGEELIHRGRGILREAAVAALAQGGYEADPRLRGAARRIMERIDAFLVSPLAEKPWVRIGNRHVLAELAAPPSFYALTMLAHMPIFRSEHYPEMERLYAYLTAPKPAQEIVQICGKEIIPQPHYVMGDQLHNRNVVDADVPFALVWLERMARLGFLKRNENWMKMFERLVGDCGRDGVWRPHKGSATPTSSNPFVWPAFPLEDQPDGESRWTDVTLRIGIIARLLGWRIELV